MRYVLKVNIGSDVKDYNFDKVEDFLKDDSFINYVLGVSDNIEKWNGLFRTNDKRLNAIAEQAKEILLAPFDVEIELPQSEAELLKSRIIKSIGI